MTRFSATLHKAAFGAFAALATLAASSASAQAGNVPVAAPEPSSFAVFAVAGTVLAAVILFARLRKSARNTNS